MPITRPSKVVPGIGRLTEPVATMIAFVASSSWSPTVTVPAAVSDPTPSYTSTLCFFSSIPTPPVRVPTTSSRRSMTLPKSTVGSPTVMPKSPASRTSCTTSAERSTALAGMHA